MAGILAYHVTSSDHGLQWRNRSRLARMVSAGVTGFPIYFLPVLRASNERLHRCNRESRSTKRGGVAT